MIHVNKPVSRSIITLIMFMFIFSVTADIVMTGEIEETSETRFYDDTTLIGEMNDYTRRSIIVDDIRYTFCSKMIVFSPRNTRVSLNDIDAAEEVQLFINDNCVRKINVLRFAQ